MKTLSVKDVAFALNMTPRGVVQRLNKGQLKGTRRTNQFGTQEWVVYATKEITQALAEKRGEAPKGTGEYNFAPDAETIDAEEVYPDNIEEETNWREQEIERLELLAEKLVKPLTDKIAAQAMMINAQEQQLEEQKRQIKLLPDLEKRAEEERKAAELRALEVEALNKQIAALEEERKTQDLKLEKVDTLEAQLAAVNAELEKLRQPWWKKMFSGQ